MTSEGMSPEDILQTSALYADKPPQATSDINLLIKSMASDEEKFRNGDTTVSRAEALMDWMLSVRCVLEKLSKAES